MLLFRHLPSIGTSSRWLVLISVLVLWQQQQQQQRHLGGVLMMMVVDAHPGAVADGRASCGYEYHTAREAYSIPDMTQAWYLRRIATCDDPVFWTKFEIVQANQPIYIAVISPELERFEDQLQFHGILYGPGLVPTTRTDDTTTTTTTAKSGDTTTTTTSSSYDNGLSEIPSADLLPPTLSIEPELFEGGAGYLTSPDRFDSCAFVDTNPVMQRFSDVHNNRCMEEFDFAADASNTLEQGTKAWSWWLYSFNHQAVAPGTYYLQTWLTSREDTAQFAQGKYEMTLGPWTWNGYATEAVMTQAHDQGTSCSCAVNALDYKEQNWERLGDVDGPSLAAAQLPGETCGAGGGDGDGDNTTTVPVSPCQTIPKVPYLSSDSATEWSGQFFLEAGKTYEWTFHAYFQGIIAGSPYYAYPDPGMYVHIVPVVSLLEDEDTREPQSQPEGFVLAEMDAQADEALTAAVLAQEGDTPSSFIVGGGERLIITSSTSTTSTPPTPQYIQFTGTLSANSTTVLLVPPATGIYSIYTQHVPSEFMSHFLREQGDSSMYVFPIAQTLYVDNEENEEPLVGGESSGAAQQQQPAFYPAAALAAAASMTLLSLLLSSV